jgi:hypothetical protein
MNLKKRENLILAVAAACVGLIIANKFFVSPMIETYHVRTTEIAKLQGDLLRGRSLIKREKEIGDELKNIVKNSLPDDTAIVEKQMFAAIERWKTMSGVTVTSRAPRWEKDVGGDIPVQAKINKLEFKIAATGNIQSITKFLYEMEADPLAIRVEDVELTSRDAAGKTLTVESRITGLVIAPEGGK